MNGRPVGGLDLSSRSMARTAALLFFLVLVVADIFVAFYALRESLYPQIQSLQQQQLQQRQQQVERKTYFPLVAKDKQALPGEYPTEVPTVVPALQPTEVLANSKYVVQPGDTLLEIAQKYGVDLDELVAVNHIANPDEIDTGQELMIPAPKP